MRVALRGIDGDAGRVALEKSGKASGPLPGEVLAAVDLDVRRNVLQRRAEARERRRADHLDPFQLERFGRVVCRPCGLAADRKAGAQRQLDDAPPVACRTVRR
jgi:hypothetical protein